MNEINPYKKTIWEDEIFDPTTGEIEQEGTVFTAERANNIEDGIYNLYDRVIGDERRIQRVEVRLALMDRSSSGNVFYDPIDGQLPSKMTLDTTKADITAPTITGATVLNVSDTKGFKEFTEVTIYDDVNKEDVLITAISTEAKTITVKALTNGYKKGAQICRSNVVLDFDNQEMKIGDWGTYSIAISEVI